MVRIGGKGMTESTAIGFATISIVYFGFIIGLPFLAIVVYTLEICLKLLVKFGIFVITKIRR